jgi:hypothetical protein
MGIFLVTDDTRLPRRCRSLLHILLVRKSIGQWYHAQMRTSQKEFAQCLATKDPKELA